MMTSNYNELFKKHFKNPQNIGKLEKHNASAEAENKSDLDKIRFYLSIENEKIEDISYQVRGCPRIIASCSYISEKVKGLKIQEVNDIDKAAIKKELGFGPNEFLCIDLPLDTIKNAISGRKTNIE